MNDALQLKTTASLIATSILLLAMWQRSPAALAQSAADDCDTAECAEVFTPNHHDVIGAALHPRLIARGGAVYMDRITENSLVLMQDTTNATQQLNANAFDFEWELGFDVSLMRKNWDDSGLEVRYLDLGRMNARTRVDASGGALRLNSTPPVLVPNVQAIEASYDTDLFGFEVNYHFPVYEPVTLLAGFRYVSFDDDLTAVLDASPQLFLYDTSVTNDLYGGQIGAVTVPCPCLAHNLWISSHIKLGIFGNEAEIKSSVDTGTTTLGVIESTGSTTFVGEIGVNVMWPISAHLSIIGGYSMLYLQDVAIASDQIPATDFFNQTGGTDQGHAIFHGAGLTLEFKH